MIDRVRLMKAIVYAEYRSPDVRRYPLEQIVDKGHKRGNAIMTVRNQLSNNQLL